MAEFFQNCWGYQIWTCGFMLFQVGEQFLDTGGRYSVSSYTQRSGEYRLQPYLTRGRATWSGQFRNAFLERGARQLSRKIIHPTGAARKDVVASSGLQEEGHVVEPVATCEVTREHVVTHVQEFITPQSGRFHSRRH